MSDPSTELADPLHVIVPDLSTRSHTADRLCYSKDYLIRLRTEVPTSQAYVEYLRANLGPVANTEAERRWTSRMAVEGLGPGPRCPDPSLSVVPSLPLRSVDCPMVTSAPQPHSVSTGPDGPKKSSRPSLERERDFSRIFTPLNGTVIAKPHRSPKGNKLEFADRLTAKMDGSGSVVPGTVDEGLKEHVSHSPREGRLNGFPEARRLSPSPRSSPKASPRASSSPSCPPGFGPPQNSRTSNNHAARILNNGKSRICKGPNPKENFATRVAYRRKKLSYVHTIQPAVSSSVSVGTVLGGKHQSKASGALSELVEVSMPKSPSNGDGVMGEATKAGLPPTVNYSICSDEFDDLAKRLADAANRAGIIENKPEKELIYYLDSRSGKEVACDTAFGEMCLEDSSEANRAVPNPDEVDALAKWFARMSESPPGQEQHREAHSPEPRVEGPTGEALFQTEQESRESLDPNVLNFFDSIRSQALAERIPAKPGSAFSQKGNDDVLEASSSQGVNRTIVAEAGREENSEQSDTTEVERFFQLFTEGKPVYDTGFPETPRSELHEDLTSVNQTKPVTRVLSEALYESDNGGLERWFARLASGN